MTLPLSHTNMFPNWLQKGVIASSLLSERFLKIGFSQNGEDDFIRAFFWDQILSGRSGTYLDVGCYSETLYSNTKLLSAVGWSGVAVDANPELQGHWLGARPKDHFLNLCVSEDTGGAGIDFFRFQDGAMSTANPERASELVAKGWQLRDKIHVPAVTLQEIAFRCHQLGLVSVDVASIDVEMVNFLGQLPDFISLMKPRLLCIECVSPNTSLKNLISSPESAALAAGGHEIVAFISGNIFSSPVKLE